MDKPCLKGMAQNGVCDLDNIYTHTHVCSCVGYTYIGGRYQAGHFTVATSPKVRPYRAECALSPKDVVDDVSFPQHDDLNKLGFIT